ncbi:MAG: hypothetical protein DMG00_10740 [Acidobacteria bacterium]|nr:MAG: hypothetical protein DMG00_10740 [Acidobacteriota bacterium]
MRRSRSSAEIASSRGVIAAASRSGWRWPPAFAANESSTTDAETVRSSRSCGSATIDRHRPSARSSTPFRSRIAAPGSAICLISDSSRSLTSTSRRTTAPTTAVVDRLWRLLADDGTLIVSVPVETGVPLLLKQAVRRVAAWRGIGDYRGTAGYNLREYAASVFAGAAPHIARPTYNLDGDVPFHDHKGFNWRALRDRLARRFAIDDVVASPVPRLGPHLATQVWFVARKKTV